MHKATILSLPR